MIFSNVKAGEVATAHSDKLNAPSKFLEKEVMSLLVVRDAESCSVGWDSHRERRRYAAGCIASLLGDSHHRGMRFLEDQNLCVSAARNSLARGEPLREAA